jgi:hypothetical protein
MIQRIQTIYLVVSLVLIALIFFVPIAQLTYNGEQFTTFRATGFYDNVSGTFSIRTISVVILIAAIISLYGISIFLYKKRVLQARICIINIILLIGLLAIFIYHVVFFVQRVPGVNWIPGLSFILPPVAIILTWLAFRGIRKDELLVRLSDRIR